ncbi:peptidoglycan hydrolase CwlO-like protein [Metabacillus crassostreae]|uniref:murein hydrolase activator EnvC family protein n=1 Tax=Metabacillus crassostreae TaxID=929098 RepID=UPI00195EFA8E|nr:M23 family metallopeptidase [Metabacillus crassostreae]MBM7606214.1 peptidoglycan hydrolase CwlO-like protein [Metabacillus crassostreae]
MKRKLMTYSLAAVVGTSGLLLPASNTTFAQTLQEKKQEIEKKQSDVSSSLENKDSEISKLEQEEQKLNSEIKKIDLQYAEINGKIREKEAGIEEAKKEIEELKIQIDEVKARIAERNKLLEDRARSLQESGGVVSYLDVLLGAQSFGDFVGRVNAVTTIVEADKEIIKAHEADKLLLEQTEADLNNKLKELKAALTELEDLKAQLEVQKNKKEELMATVEKQHDEALHEKHVLEDEAAFLAEQKKAIALEEQRQREAAARAAEEAKRQAEERKRAEAAAASSKSSNSNASSGSSSSSNSSSGGSSASTQKPAITSGTFMWPASGSFTSGYGPRWGKLHAGIDIANRSDVPIVASASGTVIRAHYSSSYGNVAYISHNIGGQVYTTLYAHMETLYVSAGQSVSKGQQIGIMGNTGHSTGQHLHFEIHKGPWNGQANAVNPLNYLP